MNRTEAIEFLTRDGGAVPCSRYGRNSEDCAPVAFALAEIVADANGDEITEDALDYAMGLVVNDHDDVLSLISEHGTEEHRALVADLLDDEAPDFSDDDYFSDDSAIGVLKNPTAFSDAEREAAVTHLEVSINGGDQATVEAIALALLSAAELLATAVKEASK